LLFLFNRRERRGKSKVKTQRLKLQSKMQKGRIHGRARHNFFGLPNNGELRSGRIAGLKVEVSLCGYSVIL
jgi:hypothetical protein